MRFLKPSIPSGLPGFTICVALFCPLCATSQLAVKIDNLKFPDELPDRDSSFILDNSAVLPKLVHSQGNFWFIGSEIYRIVGSTARLQTLDQCIYVGEYGRNKLRDVENYQVLKLLEF